MVVFFLVRFSGSSSWTLTAVCECLQSDMWLSTFYQARLNEKRLLVLGEGIRSTECSSGLTPDFDLVSAESAVQTGISLSHSVTVLLLKSSSLVVAVFNV